MKDKILYSSAIIPNDLYVERDADRKLKDVLERMSKPAYISVARQMGKTNLLIHTKRALENADNRYVYIDVTSDFKTAKDCFRYIINQILNSNEDIEEFQIAREKINILRKESIVNPSEEYQNEIREILKHYKGNLIVFLDEVDDLRKHSFSDDIFGQIRKTYFIRETYSSLKRIAYILSGVIDPEKLIKTKENSPFNIAIPIYLEDFNRNEFFELVYKSGLELDNEIKDYIFEWLNGNPRMSFEILSLVEDEYIDGNQITKELVDKIINDFYLTNFKNPPIDHIRDLINHNTDVRKALIKLKKGQIDELSDEIINKFYLFGITASKVNKQNFKIKNKVLELSLTDEWINKIELEKKGYYEFGNDKIKQGELIEGIKYLEEYINSEPNGNYVSFAKFDIGKAFYDLGNAELSNQYLIEQPMKLEKSADFYYSQLFYIGANFLKLGKFDEALRYFDEIISNAEIPQVVINAYVNKGELLINSKTEENIENVYFLALDHISNNQDKIQEKEFLQTVIYYRLGYLNHSLNKKTEAIKYFEKAKEFSKVIERPIILLYIDSCISENIEKRKEIFKELSNLIVVNELNFTSAENVIMPFVELHLYIVLTNLYDFKLFDEFNLLLNYSLNSIYNGDLKKYELLYRLAFFALNSNDIEVCEELMFEILKTEDIDLKTEMVCNQFLGLIGASKKQENYISYLENYIRIFNENNNFGNELTENDFHSFISAIDYYRNQNNYTRFQDIAIVIERFFNPNLNTVKKSLSVSILFFIMDFYSSSGNKIMVEHYGTKIISLIQNIRPKFNELDQIDKDRLIHFEKEIKNFLLDLNSNKVKQTEPVKFTKEPGRNDTIKVKYKDGREINIKYKKVIDDIKKGECILIEN